MHLTWFESLSLPAAQLVQIEAPDDDIFPVAQLVHALAPAEEYLPASHLDVHIIVSPVEAE